jgi:hypothetical protein
MSPNITPKQIIAHWQKNTLLPEYLNDRLSLENYCWHCHTAALLSTVTIVPLALGGAMQAENFVLLCNKCATAVPITKDKTFFLDWLALHSEYSFYKYALISAAKLYKDIYSTDLGDIMHDLDIDTNHLSQFLDDETKTLCEQLAINAINVATLAGIFSAYIKARQKL